MADVTRLAPLECRSANWLPQVHRQLSEIALLKSGWDGENAAAPTSETLDVAAQLVTAVSASLPTVPKPNVNPTRQGGVQFEWESGPRYFEVELSAPFSWSCFYRDTAGKEEMESALPPGYEGALKIMQHIKRVYELQ